MIQEDEYSQHSKVCHSIRACINRVIHLAPEDSIFVESGGYLGNTSKHFIEKLLASGKRFTFYCIDNWKMENVKRIHTDSLQHYKDHLGELIEHVNIISSDSLEAIKQFEDDSVFFCFLDDCHMYPHVSTQIDMWLPKMKDFSILAGDDYYCEGVRKSVKEHFNISDIESLYGNAGFLVVNPKEKAHD